MLFRMFSEYKLLYNFVENVTELHGQSELEIRSNS